jgi:hypothetical protein
MPDTSGLADSAQHWRCIRRHLNSHRYELAERAAGLYPKDLRVESTRLLAAPDWLPPVPLELDQVDLAWTGPAPAGADVTGSRSAHVRPLRPDGRRYASYAEALERIERPALLENRSIYRLLSASLDTSRPRLELTGGRYFDWVNGGEAIAHELAAVPEEDHVSAERLRLRQALGHPAELPQRSALSAVTTLTLRVPAAGDPTFVLHWRDPAAVTHAGGLYQVMPVGVFQAAAEGEQARARDLDLWRCMAREFREEYLGGAEDYPAGDYAHWPFFEELAAARSAGKLTVWCLGLGADPLTLAVDVLCVAVCAADTFDALFGGVVGSNAEGKVMTGIPFTAGTVDRFIRDEPMQPAGAAALELAWQHRRHLLGLTSGSRGRSPSGRPVRGPQASPRPGRPSGRASARGRPSTCRDHTGGGRVPGWRWPSAGSARW